MTAACEPHIDTAPPQGRRQATKRVGDLSWPCEPLACPTLRVGRASIQFAQQLGGRAGPGPLNAEGSRKLRDHVPLEDGLDGPLSIPRIEFEKRTTYPGTQRLGRHNPPGEIRHPRQPWELHERF